MAVDIGGSPQRNNHRFIRLEIEVPRCPNRSISGRLKSRQEQSSLAMLVW